MCQTALALSLHAIPATFCVAETSDKLDFLRHEPTMQQLDLGLDGFRVCRVSGVGVLGF